MCAPATRAPERRYGRHSFGNIDPNACISPFDLCPQFLNGPSGPTKIVVHKFLAERTIELKTRWIPECLLNRETITTLTKQYIFINH